MLPRVRQAGYAQGSPSVCPASEAEKERELGQPAMQAEKSASQSTFIRMNARHTSSAGTTNDMCMLIARPTQIATPTTCAGKQRGQRRA